MLVVIHVWSAFLQGMTDSTWYAPDAPPGRAVLVLRPLMPLLAALIAFAIFAYPVYWRHQAVPGGLLSAILAAGTILLLLPFTVIYELVLRGARDASSAQVRQNRADDAITVHSLVKNAAYALVNEVDNDPGAGPGDQVAGSGDARADRGGPAHGPRPSRRTRPRRPALALRDPDPAQRRRHDGGARPG